MVLVTLLSLSTLLVVATARPSAEDAYTAVLRVETIRAFYAAEGAVQVLLLAAAEGDALPIEGEVIPVGTAEATFVVVPSDTGEVIVEGRAGAAQRRISLLIE
ncbi:MAG: hypothetical protein AAFP26_14255 [Planctomycetota bacterium]